MRASLRPIALSITLAATLTLLAVPVGAAEISGQARPNGAQAGGSASGLEPSEISKAQEHLKAAGFDPGNTDGVVDPDTVRAIRQFQQANGLPATGRLDVQTRAALLEAGGLRNPGTELDRS